MRNTVFLSSSFASSRGPSVSDGKTGDVVRISPNALSFRKAEALHDIYGDRKANVIKTGWTGAALAINPGYTTHNMSDRALHTARRRLLSQAFSENALKSLETFVVEQVRVWCDHLGELKSEKSDWSEKKNMGLWSTLLTVDVLGELCFGANFGAMMNGGHLIIRLLMATAKFFQSVSPCARYGHVSVTHLSTGGVQSHENLSFSHSSQQLDRVQGGRPDRQR